METGNKLDAFLDSNRRDCPLCPDLDLTLIIFANADVVLYNDLNISLYMYIGSRCAQIYPYVDILMYLRGCVYWNPDAQGSRDVLFSSAIDENNLGRPPRPGDLLHTLYYAMLHSTSALLETVYNALPFLDPREQEIA